jgi:hypothetical protein
MKSVTNPNSDLPQDTNEEFNVNALFKDLDAVASILAPDLSVPVLFIDDADKLKQIPGEDGKQAARIILDWCVLMTKQREKIQVFLASSDSFFLEWLNEMKIAIYASVFTVGDLSKEDAFDFYDEWVNENIPKNLRLNAPGFEDLYRVLGGHMYHINLFMSDFAISQGSKTLDKRNCSNSKSSLC